jgi:Type I restriction-modification system methyltransferase subunit
MNDIKQILEKSVGLTSETKLPEKIIDYITKAEIQNTPENREAKIVFEERLHKEYGYDLDQMLPEFRIQKGSTLIGPADIVVFHDNKNKTQDNIYIIVECKRKNRKDGLEQLKTYLAGCESAEYGVWFNGDDIAYIRRLKKAPHWKVTINIPRKGEKLGLPRKDSLRVATELVKVFETCHNHIYANDGHLKDKVFNEMLKVLFIKLMDERDYTSPTCKFGITEDEFDEINTGKTNDFETRINSLLEVAKSQYKDIFTSEEKFNLKLTTLAFVVGQLQFYDLSHSSRDVKGLAFQKFVYAHQRGDRGEFFTPDPIIELATNIVAPTINDIILDPACGTGGFLVAAMKYVERTLINVVRNQVDYERARTNFALKNLRGIDFNPDLVRVSKMRMILEEDGHTGIFHANSLESFNKIDTNAKNAGALNVGEGLIDVILTNPPFGKKGTITDKEILTSYNLGHQWKKEGNEYLPTEKEMDEQVPDILFIEKCLGFLKNKGRMAIVLPDGILTGPKLQYVRDFLVKRAKIVAIISLPYSTFIPHGANVKSSILVVQKLDPSELNKLNKNGYSVFMADIEKIGYSGNKAGTIEYLVDDYGEFVYNEKGEKIIDEDISTVLSEWNKYLQANENEVWR